MNEYIFTVEKQINPNAEFNSDVWKFHRLQPVTKYTIEAAFSVINDMLYKESKDETCASIKYRVVDVKKL